eukprot:TRINITY_DN9606_c0_g1_i1.p1 TRINITY_DN9606_c0_g1~~TRINITY_DN9606_c0_g1_i1.p1  ORF type:complete len:658 (+),score=170.70 TRINITY_DN9606_c0_g1_i1:63-2036(+)
MSSIVIDFEVLPEEGPSERTAPQVCGELQRQLQDPYSELRSGEFARFAANATLTAAEGSRLGSPGEVAPPPPPPASSSLGALGGSQADALQFGALGSAPFSSQDPYHVPGSGADFTGRENLSNPELLERIAQLERQIARTAMGGASASAASRGFEDSMAPGSSTRVPPDLEALEVRNANLSQRLEAAERELREDKESFRANRLKAEQLELKLKDREQLLVHAKEMWMKENVRASKLADALTEAENKLADQEKRLAEVSERYAEAQQEVRQLQHLLGTAGGSSGAVAATAPALSGGFGGSSAGDLSGGFGADPYGLEVPGTNGFAKNLRVPATTSTLTTQAWSQPEMDGIGMSFGDEMMQHGPAVSSSLQPGAAMLPPPAEGDTNADRFRRLCLLNDAVLYEDELLQVGLKAEYSGREGQLAVFFGNKGNSPLQAFTVQYFVREEQALRLVASPLSQQLEADKQVVQRLQVALLEPFAEAPWLRLQFLLPDASPRRIQMKFPVVLPKFMVGRDLSQQDFFRYWRQQHFVLNEVTSIVHLAERLRGPLVHVARAIVFGGALRLHHGIDSNADNFVLVAQLTEPSSGDARGLETISLGADRDNGLSLIRVEVGSGRFTGKARVVVRSSNHVVSKALCDCLVTQLAEAGTGVPQAGTASAR